MNNRIFEIIQYMNGQVGLQWEEKDKQELAELIVKECVQQVNEAIPETDCSSSGAYRTAKIAATARIAKHFGVEE